MEDFKFNTIEEAIEDFKNGKMIIVADDEDRENEGDLICSGQMVTPEIIKFMAENAKGLICLAISPELAEKLDLPQMVEQNTEGMKTAFTVSIDAAEKYGVTTGISAFDRAKTIEVALAPDAVPSDLIRPAIFSPARQEKAEFFKEQATQKRLLIWQNLQDIFRQARCVKLWALTGIWQNATNFMLSRKNTVLNLFRLQNLSHTGLSTKKS